MNPKGKDAPARFVVLGAIAGMMIIIFMPDHLKTLLFGDLGVVAIMAVFVAVVVSTGVGGISEEFDKKRVNSLLIRIALVIFVVILVNHLERIFWPVVQYDYSTGVIMAPIIGLSAFVIASIPAIRRRGWGGLCS